MTPRTNQAASESVRQDSRQPLLDECAKLEQELIAASAFIAELYELDSNDCVDSQWYTQSIRIPSGNSLYIGPTKP